MEDIKWVIFRLRSYWYLIALSLLGSVLEAGGTAGITLVVKSLVDRVFILKNMEEVFRTTLFLMGFVILSQAGNFMVKFFSSLYTELEMKRLRQEAFHRLLRAEYSAFMGISAGEFASRVISDMNLYRNLIGAYTIKLIKEPVVVLFLLGVLLYRDWLLTVSLGVLLPVLFVAVRYFGAKRGKHIKRAQESYAGVADRLFSSFSGFDSIRSFKAQIFFERLFDRLNDALFRSSLRSEVYFALNSVFNYTFGYLVVALVVLYGSYRIAEGDLTPGDFISYLTALVFLQNPLVETQKGMMELRSSLPVIRRIRDILSLKEEQDGTYSISGLREGIRIEGLTVRSGDVELLKGVSLYIRRGEKVGVMGDTGAGKSTLLRVLAGLIPYEGSVKVDGVELRDIKKEDLREHFLFLSQDAFVFPGTVRENLLIAGEDRENRLWESLRLAGCDFVKSLEQEVSPASLSGGERQRLALARVFLKFPQVLLLDEITSALDAKKEEEVLNNLFSYFEGKTILLVAHRFSNLLRCDRVLVFRNGTLVFDGPPRKAIEFFLQSP